jgi:hypothetical protein
MHDSAIYAGVNPAVSGLPASAGDFVTPASISNVTIRSTSAAMFSDSIIAASSIGKVHMAKVGSNAVMPAPFGVAATTVRDYKRVTGGKAIVRKNVTQVGVFDSQDSYLAEILD